MRHSNWQAAEAELAEADAECKAQIERAEESQRELNAAIGAQQPLHEQLAEYARACCHRFVSRLPHLNRSFRIAAAGLERSS